MFHSLFAGGQSLSPEKIISSHNVTNPIRMQCNYLCYNEPKCVGFNVRPNIDEENCQLTNATKSESEETVPEGEWTLFYDVDNVCDFALISCACIR
jgi:hypothetical protein